MTPKTVMSKIEKLINDLWWVFVLQGVLTIAFGFIALLFPGILLVVLVYLFATYLVVLSAVTLIRGMADSEENQFWLLATILGAAGIAIGMYLFKAPQIAFGAFLSLAGILLCIKGLFDWFLAMYFVTTNDGRVIWIINGGVAIVAAITLWFYPTQTGSVFIWVIGVYALVSGILSLTYADRVRGYLEVLRRKIK